jgi:hypothetical protein
LVLAEEPAGTIEPGRKRMFAITVPRSDVTSDEVADALRQGLGSRYNVLPGKGINWNPVGGPRPDHPDTIVVGTGSTRLFRAQVRISQDAGETILRVTPGGLGWPRVPNRLWIARKVGQVLRAAPSLRSIG